MSVINTEAINKVDLISPLGGNGMFVKYERYSDTHMVYVECDKQVRRVAFPSHSAAIDFMNRLIDYNRCRNANEYDAIKAGLMESPIPFTPKRPVSIGNYSQHCA